MLQYKFYAALYWSPQYKQYAVWFPDLTTDSYLLGNDRTLIHQQASDMLHQLLEEHKDMIPKSRTGIYVVGMLARKHLRDLGISNDNLRDVIEVHATC